MGRWANFFSKTLKFWENILLDYEGPTKPNFLIFNPVQYLGIALSSILPAAVEKLDHQLD